MVMNALWGIGLASNILYGVFVDGTYWKIYFALLALYTVFFFSQRVTRDNGKRKTIMISTWNGKRLLA